MGTCKIDLEKLSEEERAVVEARRAYKKAWRAANIERVKEYDRRFWAKKAAESSGEKSGNKE